MKILVIGGTGILSSAVVDESISQGAEVYMVNRGRRQTFINPKAKLIKCDVHNKEALENLLGNDVYDSVIDFLIYTKEQLKDSLDIFSKRAKQYVFISSTAVYNTDYDLVFDEDSPKVQKKWEYSVDKNECEKLLVNYCEENHVNYTIVRPGVNYGNTRIPFGIYPSIGCHWWFYARIAAEKPMIVWNNGKNVHNLTHVEDFAVGVVGLLDNPKAYNESFNVVGDNFYTWREVLECVARIAGKELKLVNISPEEYAQEIPSRSGELLGGRAKNCRCSNKKLKAIVPAFRSNISLEYGIGKTLEFYKAHGYLSGIDYSYEGDYDRIIKKLDKGQSNFRLSYIDYLNDSMQKNFKNYLRYFYGKHKDSAIIRIIYKLLKK